MSKKVIYAMYDDDHKLLVAAKSLVAHGIKIKDVYSPFPIHGIDPVIGVKKTRLAICAFIYGLTGLTLALVGMNYFMIQDWSMNIGGKPSFSLIQNLPSFIPITFEFTVLLAAHGMALTYFIRNWTFPGVSAKNPDPRTTDDKFLMEIHQGDNKKVSESEILNLINQSGVYELNIKDLA
jgi:hypothetical protein